MKRIFHWLFVQVPPAYRADFLHEIGVQNINRLLYLGLVVSILEIASIVFSANPDMTLHMALIVFFNVLFLPFLWYKKKSLGDRKIKNQAITVAGWTAYLVYGFWLSMVWYILYNRPSLIPPYLVAVYGLAAALIVHPRVSLATFFPVAILFIWGVNAFSTLKWDVKDIVVNTTVMNVVAWLISRLMFQFRLNSFIAQREIEQEKEKSEKLLLNILPAKVAQRLKESGYTAPERFDGVTVCFSDLVDFTAQSTILPPDVLIRELNELFTGFDEIAERYSCERIKTSGDAYLFVCGMPERHPGHAQQAIRAALDILEFLQERNRNHTIQWRMRIGVHSGSVVGGVVGIKKYIYDIFGDTVNTASRMENHSEPMKINISETTWQLAKEHFPMIEREPEHVKGKGYVKMYFVSTGH